MADVLYCDGRRKMRCNPDVMVQNNFQTMDELKHQRLVFIFHGKRRHDRLFSLSASLSAHTLAHPLRLPLPYSASLTQMPYEVLLMGHGMGAWGRTDSFGPEQPHGRMAKKKKKAMTGSWHRIFVSSLPPSLVLSPLGRVGRRGGATALVHGHRGL